MHMKKIKNSLLDKILLLFFISHCLFIQATKHNFFSKVIIWGHPLHSHTHSYIHYGFFRTFQQLGYEVYWVQNQNELVDIDLHNALFITEGQVDSNIPQR